MAERSTTLSIPDASAHRWSRSRRRAGQTLSNYLFIAPYLVFFLVFSIEPTLYGFYMSLFHWQILATHQDFAGLDNYRKLIGDSLFWTSFGNTLYFTALTVLVEAAVELLVA